MTMEDLLEQMIKKVKQLSSGEIVLENFYCSIVSIVGN